MRLIQNILRSFCKNPDSGKSKHGHRGYLLSQAALLLGASFLLASCSDDLLSVDDSQQVTGTDATLEQPIYFKLKIGEAAAEGTRFEAGSETSMINEAKVDNVIVILSDLIPSVDANGKRNGIGDYHYSNFGYDETFRVLAFAEAYSTQIEDNNDGTFTLTAKAEESDFAKFYGGDASNDHDFYIFAIANSKDNLQVSRPVVTRNIQSEIHESESDLNSLIKKRLVKESDGYFLMTSKAAYPIRLSLDELHRQHYTPATALDLNSRNTGNKGPLEIHRMVARIDLDWQRMKFAIDAETGESTRIDRKGFGIYEYEDIENPANVKYSLTIDGVALANISRDYKLFNESGYFNDNPSKDEDGEWRIFGNFTESNNGNNFDYARDPKGVTKASSFGIDYFYQGMNDLAVDKNSGKSNKKHSDFYFTNLKDFATADTHWGGLDENEHWNDYFEGDLEVPGNETYVAWHYTLPNSIHLKNKQQKNNTTAVIYRAMIGDNALIEQAEREGKDVFAYGNDIYGNFDQFRSAALEEDSEGNLVNKGKNINVLFGTTWDRYVALVKASNYNDRVSALRTQIATLESQIREIEQMIPEIARLRAENAELDAVYEELSPEDQENNRKEKTNNENIINRNKNRYRELIGSEYIDQTLEDQEVVNFISETNAEISNLSRLADDLNDNSKFDEDGNLRLTFYDAELFRKAAKEAGLRTYQATNVGTKAQPDYHYYCYYYYWIRHRDNSNDMMMGPMEFAIVRNYVYKLSIGKIFDLGYPDDPGDDPDPEIPGDPVEDAKVKLKVNVKVLPWGVRYDDDITLY